MLKTTLIKYLVYFISFFFFIQCNSKEKVNKSEKKIEDFEKQKIEKQEFENFDEDVELKNDEKEEIVFDAREPICPAHPDGPKINPGYSFLMNKEHKYCTKEHCIHDLREEMQKQIKNDEMEQLLKELGYKK